MIPKIIHYCWFGRNPLPQLARDCIASWRQYCPDYEIVEWNEDNFDVNQNPYVKEAYEAKMYAFVADYARLVALYTVGGVYLDTDVRVLRPLDGFLDNGTFAGFESLSKIATAVMGSEPLSDTVKRFLDYYEGRHFLLKDGSYDTTTNVEIITDIVTAMGLRKNGEKQTVAGITVYPYRIFCPILSRLDDKEYLKDSYTIHYYNGSWKSERTRRREKSLLFKIVSAPLSLISRLLTIIFGERWSKLKKKIRAKLFRD